MSAARSDCMYRACSYNLHSTDSRISTWVKYRLRCNFIRLFSSFIQYNALRSSSIVCLGICDASRQGTGSFNWPSHHKTSPVHRVTSPTPPSWNCGPVHYFAGWDLLDSWIHLLVPSNDPSQWTYRVACSNKGHLLTMTTITSKDWVNNVHQLLVNNV